MSRYLVKSWARLYTLAAPKKEREGRCLEVLSDLHEHVKDCQVEGYRPAETAVQILFRMVWGLKDDLAWSAPYLRSTLSERLERGSEAISHLKTSYSVISCLALFGMFNLAFLLSDGHKPWTLLLFTNISIPVVAIVLSNRQRTWARRLIRWYCGIASVLMVGVLLWVVLEYHLYQMPTFYQVMLQFSVAMLPLVLMMLVSNKLCRVRLFKGHRWPIFVCWALIISISLGIAIAMGLIVVLTIWTVMVLMVLTFMVMSIIFLSGAAVVYYGGLKVSAECMLLIAAGIRRLK